MVGFAAGGVDAFTLHVGLQDGGRFAAKANENEIGGFAHFETAGFIRDAGGASGNRRRRACQSLKTACNIAGG